MASVLLALRLAVGLFAEPMGDEAYYWVWGQHPGWSYYDHPPLQAWVQGVTTALLGQSLFALRLPSLLALGGTLYVLYLFARRVFGTGWQSWFLATIYTPPSSRRTICWSFSALWRST
ncbi:MAG: glycosyltransferase family 39 protein [Alphaproteobacteria bacterium]|nr:glycosyltransferase family 39 protein [Alphaproteobacteria bacterium]